MTTLIKQVDNWANGFKNAKVRGLVVMTDVINHIAQHRDTDAALRLLSKVDDPTRTAFGRFIRARFGHDVEGKPVVTARKDATHSSGWKIILPKVLPDLTNETSVTWGIVTDALSAKANFDDSTLHKKLRSVWEEDKPVKEYDYKAVAKRLIKAVEEHDGNIYALITEIHKQVKGKNKTNEPAIVVEENFPENVKEMKSNAA